MTSGPFGSTDAQPQPEENIPDSVRSAPDLSQMSGSAQPEGAPSQTGRGTTYRRAVTTTEEFQEVAQLSGRGPVVFALYSGKDQQAVDSVAQLEQLVNQAGGRILLAAVDIDQAPEIAQAFQIQGTLGVVAMLGGRPAPMYNSPVPAEQIQELLGQVLQLAQQSQLTGTFEPVAAGGTTEPAPLPPEHQKAQAAIEQGDYEAAADAYKEALRDKPADREAKIGLARVGLLQRVQDQDLDQAREAAASRPDDVEAQLAVADLDVSGGHVEDAFNRLIRLIQRSDAQTKDTVRERLLELFEVVGAEDERVVKARGALMRALF